jgi:hypothetical protein
MTGKAQPRNENFFKCLIFPFPVINPSLTHRTVGFQKEHEFPASFVESVECRLKYS